jgi:hypothetical protein
MLDLPTEAIYLPENNGYEDLPTGNTITLFHKTPEELTPESRIVIRNDTQTIKDDESKTSGILILPKGDQLEVDFSSDPYFDPYGLDKIRKRSQEVTKLNSEQSRVRVIKALGVLGSSIVVWSPAPDSASYYDEFDITRSRKADDEKAEEYLSGLVEITEILGAYGLICATFDTKHIRSHKGALLIDDQRSVRSLDEGDVVYRTMETYYEDLAKQGITGRQFRKLFIQPLYEIISKQEESLLHRKGIGSIKSFLSDY